MLIAFQGLFIFLIEIYCFILFVDSFYESICEDSLILKLFRYLIMLEVSIGIWLYFMDYMLIRFVVDIIILALIFMYFNKKSYLKNVLLCLVFLGIVLLADFISLAIYSTIVPNYMDYMTIIQQLVVLLSKSVLLFIVLVIKRVIDKRNVILLKDSEWIKFLFFPIFTIIITTVFVYNSESVIKNGLESILWIISFGLVGVDIFVFYFIIDIANKQRIINEKEILRVQAQNQLLYFEKIKEEVDNQHRISHEYNNQIECMNALINNDNYLELKKYMSEITNVIRHDTDFIDTNNAIVNAIVNSKYHEAVDKGIVFIFFINDLSKLVLSSEDIVVLLVNTLNNAIEACEKSDEKIIKLKIIFDNDAFIVSVKNTYNGYLKKINKEIQTIKEDYINHGYGLKNIERVVTKNKGDYCIEYDENYFYISIMIPQNYDI